jgi:hypothetical protein
LLDRAQPQTYVHGGEREIEKRNTSELQSEPPEKDKLVETVPLENGFVET